MKTFLLISGLLFCNFSFATQCSDLLDSKRMKAVTFNDHNEALGTVLKFFKTDSKLSELDGTAEDVNLNVVGTESTVAIEQSKRFQESNPESSPGVVRLRFQNHRGNTEVNSLRVYSEGLWNVTMEGNAPKFTTASPINNVQPDSLGQRLPIEFRGPQSDFARFGEIEHGIKMSEDGMSIEISSTYKTNTRSSEDAESVSFVFSFNKDEQGVLTDGRIVQHRVVPPLRGQTDENVYTHTVDFVVQ